MAEALLTTMSQDQQEWEKQFGYERFVHDCISREKYAYTQGIEQGISQGERNARLEDAKNLLKLGVSIDIITKATGITENEL